MNSKVDAYVRKATKWQAEIRKLRELVLEFELSEELKWGKPCYSLGGKNVVLIVPFKAYCAVLFCKGALLKNREGMLIQPTENMQASRQARFTSVHEIVEKEAVFKACMREAIEVEQAGLEVTYKKTEDFDIPAELQLQLDKRPAFKEAFYALTPGRQRGYILHFSAAKHSATRAARVEKYMPQIFAGKGLIDAYVARKKR